MSDIEKRDIRALSKDEIKDFFVNNGDKAFRAKQVYEWLWSKGVHTFEDMTNLSIVTRELLNNNFVINHINVDEMQRSSDGTIKNAIKLYDGNIVESVLIPTDKRTTACVSSQVGCALNCAFCATARLKNMRNLGADEIYDQVVVAHQQSNLYYGHPLSNIVFMGMGEPLMNYEEVIKAIGMITSDEGLQMSPRRIMLSTAGLPKMIKRMADEDVKFGLAVSIHSAIDSKRSKMMPINQKNSLADLADSLVYWYSKTKRRVTYEYVIWDGFNDKKEDIDALVKFAKILPCKINIIEYNEIEEDGFKQAAPEVTDAYQKALESAGIVVNVRRSRGKDIDAACGQLANKHK
ncbi:MAG: 23S rRNA (adenine(2503)-C(2))-methyltransferase RlmN [Ichthyobacteriaceae bacterium]|nr:23S rRNA (adenine(2503)-C(2))-methyltransferase RlmN [Ichthyobacteriaceae bacterium]